MSDGAREELAQDLRQPSFSGVVEIVRDREPLVRHAAGLARLDPRIPIECSTRFGVASITKMFTVAATVAVLKERGWDLNHSIAPYVNGWLPADTPVSLSIRSLLGHTSGLGDYIDDDAELPFDKFPVEELTSNDSFRPYVEAVEQVPPGPFFYSSAGFILVGAFLEAIEQKSYQDVVEERVTRPAGLTATGFGRVDDPAADFAWGYLESGSPNHAHIPPVGGPDGGIVTNAADLRRFFDWLKRSAVDGGLLSEAMRPVTRLDERDSYGLGFDAFELSGERWVGHTGSDPGVSARAMCSLDSDSSILVLCNRRSIAFRAFRLALAWLDSGDVEPLDLTPK